MAFSDNDLIERIRRGERRRFALLVDRYRDKAYSLAVRILHNREDAEEAVQDAFVRAYRSLGKFEGKAKFSTWFYRIAYNVCMSRVLRADEPPTVEFNEESGSEHGSFPVFHEYEHKDMIEFVRRTIDGMPPKYSAVLTLFYLQDMTHEEICEITELPLGTVKVHLHRARKLLQEAVENELKPGRVAV